MNGGSQLINEIMRSWVGTSSEFHGWQFHARQHFALSTQHWQIMAFRHSVPSVSGFQFLYARPSPYTRLWDCTLQPTQWSKWSNESRWIKSTKFQAINHASDLLPINHELDLLFVNPPMKTPINPPSSCLKRHHFEAHAAHQHIWRSIWVSWTRHTAPTFTQMF